MKVYREAEGSLNNFKKKLSMIHRGGDNFLYFKGWHGIVYGEEIWIDTVWPVSLASWMFVHFHWFLIKSRFLKIMGRGF